MHLFINFSHICAVIQLSSDGESSAPVSSTKVSKNKKSVKARKQSAIDAFTNKYTKNSLQKRRLDELITYYLCKDGVPTYMVEKPGFQALIAGLDPRYCLVFE